MVDALIFFHLKLIVKIKLQLERVFLLTLLREQNKIFVLLSGKRENKGFSD
jgi:hypothetical protein